MSLTVKLICEKCKCQFSVDKKTAAKHKDNILCRNCRISETKKNKSDDEKQKIEEKRKSTCKDRFGVDCCFNTEKSRDALKRTDWNKRNIKSKSTKKEKYGDENFNNKEKSLKTMTNKYGQHSSKDDTVKEKKSKTCSERFGGNSPICNNRIRKQAEATKLRKYGNKNNIEKAKVTWLSKYSVDNPMKCRDIIQKALETKHFNVLRKRGLIYNNIYFDSTWELAYYIWLTDNKKDFTYQPQPSLLYIDENSIERQYYPDFLVDGQLIEIKGSQFFNEKDEPYNLYRKEYWWHKYNFLIKHKIYIMREKEAFMYVKYVNEKYGKDYLKSFKISLN